MFYCPSANKDGIFSFCHATIMMSLLQFATESGNNSSDSMSDDTASTITEVIKQNNNNHQSTAASRRQSCGSLSSNSSFESNDSNDIANNNFNNDECGNSHDGKSITKHKCNNNQDQIHDNEQINDPSHDETHRSITVNVPTAALEKIKQKLPKFRHEFTLKEKLLILKEVDRCGNKKRIAREFKTTAKSILNWIKNRDNMCQRSLLNPRVKTAHKGHRPKYNDLENKVHECVEKM